MSLDKKNYVIYSSIEMEGIARTMCEELPDRFTFNPIDWDHFPDGTPNIFIHGIDNHGIEGKDILFLASFPKAIQKFDQLSVLMVLCESFINSMTILLPFLPTATMERV